MLKLLTQRTIEAGGGGVGGGGGGGEEAGSGGGLLGSRSSSTLKLVKALSPLQASAARDNVAKLVYELLFDWVTAQTNSVLVLDHNEAHSNTKIKASASAGAADSAAESAGVDSAGADNTGVADENGASGEVRSLGLLDLFGFESFLKNDMEQLLINLANEALQDMYCKQVLMTRKICTANCFHPQHSVTIVVAFNLFHTLLFNDSHHCHQC